MSDHKVTPAMIYEATNGGLDIIHQYYPQSMGCERTKKAFKIREEATASARLSLYDGIWWVKDYGDSTRAMTAIDVVLKEDLRKPTFYEALIYLAEKYGIANTEGKVKNQYSYEKRAFDPEKDNEGEVSFETKEWDMAELQSIFSRRIWEKLMGKNRKSVDGNLEPKSDERAMENAVQLCKDYGLIPLKYYETVGRDKETNNLVVHRFGATPSYPVLMWEAGTWQKIYKPTERNKKYRFLIRGQKNDVMFGYANAFKKFEAQTEKTVSEEGEEVIKEKKLDEIIICSGGSDALNVAALGYAVVWFDSETFRLSSKDYSKLAGIAERIYYLPDIDNSGVREAVRTGMDYLNIHLIFLPKDLRKQYDMRGNACKDVRDFFRLHGEQDFETCLKQSFPLRFWDESLKFNKKGEIVKKNGRAVVEYKPNNELMYNFLYRNDFGLYELESENDGETLVRKEGNVVRKIKFRDINRFLKEFLDSESVMRLVGYGYMDIKNAFHRSAQFTENSMKNLKFLNLDFEDTGKGFQYMFFENETWKITADGIKALQNDKVPVNAWAEECIPDKVKVLEQPPFEIFKNEKGDFDIKINRTDCHLLNFLIQTSRIYWQEELEVQLDKHDDDYKRKYLKENQFNIAGSLLTPQEQQEQKMVLISKLLANGYLLHRHKDQSEAYAVWAMDYNMFTNTAGENDSNGGTGKSINYLGLSRYMQTKLIAGRDRKTLESAHLLEGMSEHTDYLYVDDAMKGIDFDFFYSMITNFTSVNPKGLAGYTIPFSKSAKIAITSNFPPAKNDKSTRRRMWFASFSDYYHKNTNGEYREERLPKDDFGMTLFDDFTPEQWNLTDNLLATCVQSWLKWGKVEAGEENIIKNILLQKMGANFLPWADEFFHKENGNLNTYVQRLVIYEDLKKKVHAGISPQGMVERLRAYCQYKGYIFNPVNELGRDGRIMKHVTIQEYRNGEIRDTDKKGTRECFYIKTDTEGEPLLVPGSMDEGMPF